MCDKVPQTSQEVTLAAFLPVVGKGARAIEILLKVIPFSSQKMIDTNAFKWKKQQKNSPLYCFKMSFVFCSGCLQSLSSFTDLIVA